jgi:hypothetical protein
LLGPCDALAASQGFFMRLQRRPGFFGKIRKFVTD